MNSVLSVGVILKAKDFLSSKIGAANKNLIKFDAKINKIGKSMLKMGAGSAAVGTAILAPMKTFYDDYTQIAKKEGELESLGIGAKGIAAITKEAKGFSNQVARVSAPEFLNSAYDIKSGISSLSDVGVAKMTALSSMTAQATKSTGQEMSKLFALGYGIFGKDFKNDFDFGEKFSAAISTSVQAFRTDGSDLALGLSNIGAAAKSMGVSLEEELAIVGVGKSIFNSASEAGTGYRAFLTGVGKAQDELGLKFTDSNGKMLPMVDILNKIKNKYKDLESVKTKDLLKDAFGSDEATKLIAGLITKTDELSQAQVNLKKNMSEGTAITEKMAKTMNKGYGIELMTNRLVNLTSTIGSKLEPMVSKLTSKIGNMAIKIKAWMEENEELSASIVKWTAIGGTALVVGGGMLMTFGLIAKALPLVTLGFKAFAPVLTMVKLAFNAMAFAGGALLANPVLGSIALVLGFAAKFIWDNWSTLEPKFTKFFDWIANKFNWFITKVADLKSKIQSLLSFDGIKDISSKLSSKLPTFSGVKSFLGFESKEPTKIVPQKSKQIVTRRDRRAAATSSQNVTVHKIEINNPTSTVEVQKGVEKGLRNIPTSLEDEVD